MEIKNIIADLTSLIDQKSKMLKLLNKWKNKYQYCIKDIANCDSAFVAKYIHAYQQQQSIQNNQIDLQDEEDKVSKENTWRFNQFKAFVWIVVGICEVLNRELKQIKNSQIRFILDVFCLKDQLFIRYNIHRLEKLERGSNKNWSNEKLQLFTDILKNEEIKDKWNIISYELFEKSQGMYFQSPHRCRQMWYNHLNPKVNHGEWSNEEDYELFSSISNFGRRWANISRAMDGSRTEHMVKNRYTCLIKRNRITFKRLGYQRFITYFLKQLRKKVKGKSTASSKNPKGTQLTKVDDSVIYNNGEGLREQMRGQIQDGVQEIQVQPFMVEWFHLRINNEQSYFDLEQDLGCRFRQHQTHFQFLSQEEREQISGQ